MKITQSATYFIYNLDYEYCGKSTTDKLCDIREYMESVGATCHVIASLEDIAWILNIRGNDIKAFLIF